MNLRNKMNSRKTNNVQELLQQIEQNMMENQKEINELNKLIRDVDKSQKDFKT